MAAMMRISSVIRSKIPQLREPIKTLKPNVTRQQQVRFSTENKLPWEVNTNVQKDVVLYAHSNDKFHRVLNLFGLVAFGMFAYLAEFSISTLKYNCSLLCNKNLNDNV